MRMKKNFRLLAGAAIVAAASMVFSSCAYDPYYSSTSIGGSYGSGGGYGGGGYGGGGYGGGGYGYGHGYGGRSFNTSLFVSTGNSRWGYDPYCYSYYDYNRRAYYDPYLYGYYPVGYRPPVVYGTPHPYGWHSGSSYIQAPSRVNNVTVANFRNRESAYRNSNYDWARQVRQAPSQQQNYQRERSTLRQPFDAQNYQQPIPGTRREQPARPSSRFDRTVSTAEVQQPQVQSQPQFQSQPQVQTRPQRQERRPFESRPQRPDRTQFESRPQSLPQPASPEAVQRMPQENGAPQRFNRGAERRPPGDENFEGRRSRF